MIGKAARVFRKFLDFLGLISGLAQNSDIRAETSLALPLEK
jgi:hypothetical protein